ncbi:MAG: D-alanine--D-alanine ligase [Candidatus Paceibacterota bacterium]|jgi:D-alanine-D-alanine ligase
MSRIRVGVLRGGPSSEYDVSLKTGASVLKNLSQDKYQPVDIFVSKDGVWHVHGVAKKPEQVIKHLDVIFNAMHGQFGEDGTVQRFLDTHGMKYTGSGSLASAVGMNKSLSKKRYKAHDLRTPIHLEHRKGTDTSSTAKKIFFEFSFPCIIKPASAGSSVGVHLVTKRDDIIPALEDALQYSDNVIIEEYIRGKEATCGVIEAFRGSPIYSLPPVEIRKPAKNAFFDYEAKYSGVSQEICPGNFTEAEKEEIQRLAREAHSALGLRHYSRSDFMITPKGRVYLLETNTLPGLTAESLLPKSLAAVGCKFAHFLDHVLSLALAGK